jgi:hypothetical protein
MSLPCEICRPKNLLIAYRRSDGIKNRERRLGGQVCLRIQWREHYRRCCPKRDESERNEKEGSSHTTSKVLTELLNPDPKEYLAAGSDVVVKIFAPDTLNCRKSIVIRPGTSTWNS